MPDPKRVKVHGDLYHGKVPLGACYVGRAAPGLRRSPYRNPFKVGKELTFPFDEIFGPTVRDRAHAVEIFATYARITCGYELLARELRGRDLACWCPLDEPCHADWLLFLANGWDMPPEPTRSLFEEWADA